MRNFGNHMEIIDTISVLISLVSIEEEVYFSLKLMPTFLNSANF